MLDHTTIRAGAIAFVLLAPMGANAALVTPAGLSAGQGYRLAFITADTINGTYSDIGTYNNVVTKQAMGNADLRGLSWSAIVSTATTNAVDNVSCPGCNDVPIYLVDGTKVASSTAALFTTDLLHAINRDQFGIESGYGYIWTGSTRDGRAYGPMGSGSSNVGYPSSTNAHWIDADFSFFAADAQLPLYALSSELFVAGAMTPVPEPATLALLGTGGLLALGARRRAKSS